MASQQSNPPASGSTPSRQQERKSQRKAADTVSSRLWQSLDQLASRLLYAEKSRLLERRHADKPNRTRILSPEADVRHLMTTASNLDDLWRFFQKRLQSTTDVDFMCFSLMDESGDFLKVRFLEPMAPHCSFDDPIISMADRQNHLVQAYQRMDTTFCADLNDLGPILLPYVDSCLGSYYAAYDDELELPDPSQTRLNLFSVPFLAGGRAIAMLTIGFKEIDTFSQAKLSYIYTLRDQIAQLVWNLTLQDRMNSQAQLDNLTGLFSHSFFQQVLTKELSKAEAMDTAITTMVLDINNIQEINQRLGHAAGDETICYLASTVRRLIRGLDTVARYGGDEVVVALPETDALSADEVAKRFIQGFKANLPAHLNGASISIGYATYPNDTKHGENLLKLTEQALHLAKFKGAKTGLSIHVPFRETSRLNEKTVLEVFASHVAKKYSNHQQFGELMRIIENRDSGENTGTADELMLETIGSLAGALDAKDKYTRGHSQAVANYAVALAHALKLSPEDVEQIRIAGFLHDIGKIGIPESILCKKGPLNEKEWEIMKQHPVIGARQILAPVSSLKNVIPMVEHHHENWDGKGYPSGLSGIDIPLGARIVSIVDAFHGLTSDRSYRKALPIQEAADILQQGAGSKWDPYLIEVFTEIIRMAKPKASSLETDKTPESASLTPPEVEEAPSAAIGNLLDKGYEEGMHQAEPDADCEIVHAADDIEVVSASA